MIDLLKRARKLLDGAMIRYTSSEVEAERKLVFQELSNLISSSEAELAALDAYVSQKEEESLQEKPAPGAVVRLPVIQ
jgi:hypothetical protein